MAAAPGYIIHCDGCGLELRSQLNHAEWQARFPRGYTLLCQLCLFLYRFDLNPAACLDKVENV